MEREIKKLKIIFLQNNAFDTDYCCLLLLYNSGNDDVDDDDGDGGGR